MRRQHTSSENPQRLPGSGIHRRHVVVVHDTEPLFPFRVNKIGHRRPLPDMGGEADPPLMPSQTAVEPQLVESGELAPGLDVRSAQTLALLAESPS